MGNKATSFQIDCLCHPPQQNCRKANQTSSTCTGLEGDFWSLGLCPTSRQSLWCSPVHTTSEMPCNLENVYNSVTFQTDRYGSFIESSAFLHKTIQSTPFTVRSLRVSSWEEISSRRGSSGPVTCGLTFSLVSAAHADVFKMPSFVSEAGGLASSIEQISSGNRSLTSHKDLSLFHSTLDLCC